MRTVLLVAAVILGSTSLALGQGGVLGVYSDPAGASCNLDDSVQGLCSYYVVHSFAPGVTGVQFRVISEHLGTPLPDQAVFPVTVGTAADGVFIGYSACTDATNGLHVLTLNYFCQGTTPACATMEIVGHPTATPPGLLAFDCASNLIPLQGWTSTINNDGSCECAPPTGNDAPVISVTPASLIDTLRQGETSTHFLTISNTGAVDLEFDIDLVGPLPSAAGPQQADSFVVFFDDMESGAVGWFHYSTDGGVDLWALSTNRSWSGTTSWRVSQHDNSGADALQSPSIDLGDFQAASLEFYHWYDFDYWNWPYTPDAGIVEISTNGGINWNQIFPVGGYPSDVCGIPGLNCINGNPLFCDLGICAAYLEKSNAFVPAVFDLTPYTGRTISIRFHAGWNLGNSGPNEGWYIDDVLVVSRSPSWLSVNPPSGTVPPDSSLDVAVTFDATDLPMGSYDIVIPISSNDILTPNVLVPAHLEGIGEPNIAVSDTLIDYGTNFLGYPVTDTLVVINQPRVTPYPAADTTGLGLLVIDGVSTDHADFTVDGGGFTLLPFERRELPVTFAAATLGPISATLTITSNDLDEPIVTVALRGETLELPVIHVAPDSLGDSLMVDETSAHVLTITNTGRSDLEFDISVRATTPAVPAMSVDDAVSSVHRRSGILRGELRRASTSRFSGVASEIIARDPEHVASVRFPASPTAGPAVALVASEAGAFAGDVRTKLLSTGRFASVTFIDVGFVTPTVAELQAFDAVAVWFDYPYYDQVSLGNNLADYVDSGGGVVLAVPETGGVSGRYLGGRWESEAYFVIARSNFQEGPATLGTVLDSCHHIMRRVSAFDGGDRSYRPSTTSLTSGATLVATWSDGAPLVAVNSVNGVRRADLGFWLPSSDVDPGYWQVGTDGTRLLANALEWVSGIGVEWLCFSPAGGTLAADSTLDVDVTFDATNLPEGTYDGDIAIASNDPVTPQMIVPVSLYVGGIVPVLIQGFSGRPVDYGIELTWGVVSDEEIQGFRIYRGKPNAVPREVPVTDNLLPPDATTFLDGEVQSATTYRYVLAVVLDDGSELRSHPVTVRTGAYSLTLYQNYPNPFNPTTTIAFTLPEKMHVTLSIYTLDGKLVRTLVSETLAGGSREFAWDGTDDRGSAVSSGVYFYKLIAGKRSLSRKLVYLK